MTIFEEMTQVAKEAQNRWLKRNEAATDVLTMFYRKFHEYTRMPFANLTLMPWDKDEHVYKMLKEGEINGIPFAMRRDEEMDEWSLGMYIDFAPKTFSGLFVHFAVFTTEKDGSFIFRLGRSTRSYTINPDVDSDWNTFFASMVEDIKGGFRTSWKEKSLVNGEEAGDGDREGRELESESPGSASVESEGAIVFSFGLSVKPTHE